MKAGVFHGAGDVRVEEVADPGAPPPRGAVLRIVRSSVCGSDLWSYRGPSDWQAGWRTGHEMTGIVEQVGDEVTSVAEGDLVVSAFFWSCGDCAYCRAGLHTSCTTGAFPGGANHGGGQAERVMVPHADGSLWKVPDGTPEERFDQVHLLTDVLLTGYHAAKLAGVGEPGLGGDPVTTAVVVGDGAVGLSGVVGAKLLGATTIVLVGHHADRLEIAASLGATHTTDLRGRDLARHLREVTDGGAEAVLECVGVTSALRDAAGAVAPGGRIGSVGVPAGVEDANWMRILFGKNASLHPGIAPTSAYVEEVGPLVASGELDVSAIASDTFALADLPAAYEAMDQRTVVKAILRTDEV
jgi:alcohol dehydrogenase